MDIHENETCVVISKRVNDILKGIAIGENRVKIKVFRRIVYEYVHRSEKCFQCDYYPDWIHRSDYVLRNLDKITAKEIPFLSNVDKGTFVRLWISKELVDKLDEKRLAYRHAGEVISKKELLQDAVFQYLTRPWKKCKVCPAYKLLVAKFSSDMESRIKSISAAATTSKLSKSSKEVIPL